MKRMICTALLGMAVAAQAYAQPAQLPRFVLPDPGGTNHASTALAKNGLVLVMTAPTLHAKSAQEGWDDHLLKAMPKSGARLAFIEDMSVSDFKGIARKDMKKDWKPGIPPLLLIDDSGSVRKSLGVGRDETTVLVYDSKGNLVYTESGKPSAAAARAIWSKLHQE